MPQELGGGPATVLSDGVRSGWGSVSLPPSWTFKLVAESESEEAAAQLAVALRKGLASIAERAELSQPGLGEAVRAALEPRAEGNLVVVAAGREKFERLKRAVAPLLVRARQTAPRVISASRMRNQVVGCLMYAAERETGWPKDLETLVKSGHISPDMLVDPARPDDVPAYIYVRPDEASMAKSDLSKHAVLYENFAAWPKGGVNVAYADGHVELIEDEAAFRKVVEYAKKHAAK
jgi:prepilin-type processing-associated H-X9-DG protein